MLKENLETMAGILWEMQFPSFDKAGEWAVKLKNLKHAIKTPPRQGWVFDHILYKALMMALDHKIGDGSKWKSPGDILPVQELIDMRLALSEELWRDIYGLGNVAHVFVPERMYPGWYSRYDEIMGISKGLIKPGSIWNKNA